MDTLRVLHPERAELGALSEETRVIESEPPAGRPGGWNDESDSHVGIIRPGEDELRPFGRRA